MPTGNSITFLPTVDVLNPVLAGSVFTCTASVGDDDDPQLSWESDDVTVADEWQSKSTPDSIVSNTLTVPGEHLVAGQALSFTARSITSLSVTTTPLVINVISKFSCLE